MTITKYQVDKEANAMWTGIITTAVGVLYLPNYNPAWGELAYEHEGDSGFDLRAAIEDPVIIKSGERAIIPSGLKIKLMPGTELQVRSRSGNAAKLGLAVLNSPGTIDQCYTGEIGIILINHDDEPIIIKPGMKIAQAVIAPVLRATFSTITQLSETTRGEGGFGSTDAPKAA